jgi:hypothetical protein
MPINRPSAESKDSHGFSMKTDLMVRRMGSTSRGHGRLFSEVKRFLAQLCCSDPRQSVHEKPGLDTCRLLAAEVRFPLQFL